MSLRHWLCALVATSTMGAAGIGCQLEPGSSCDDTRISWGFDDHEISSADDVSSAPGLQVDILLLTGLPEGRSATLTVTGTVAGEDEVEVTHPQTGLVAANGDILFEAVEVPVGSVVFSVLTSNDCRPVESARRRFVLDDGGLPVCELEFLPQTRAVESQPPLRSYIGADDQDPLLPQLQASMQVVTNRAQMTTRLLLLNRDTETSSIAERTTGEDGSATFAVSLGQGEIAARALCIDGLNDVPQSSATFSILVDTEAPDCDLIGPSARVVAGDDLDGNAANGVQVRVVVQTSDETNFGLDAEFSVNAGPIETGTIGPAGQSSAIVTIDDVGGAQDFAVTLPDLAGNTCVATASF